MVKGIYSLDKGLYGLDKGLHGLGECINSLTEDLCRLWMSRRFALANDLSIGISMLLVTDVFCILIHTSQGK